MTQRLLSTKLFFPRARSKLVPRPRLIEQLDAGLHKPLTLVSAPAGYGKTTLLSEWHLTLGGAYPLAWLSLDAGDNHLARFLTYVSAAMGTVDPGLSKELVSLLDLPQLPPMEELVTALINDANSIPHDFALILDDCHVITDPAIHAALVYLLEHMPPHMHLVMLTRSDPPIPLSRLRARGEMMELRLDNLRFTDPEATLFLNGVMDLDLSGENVSALEQRTEGWIAGLQLAALSMQAKADTARFITDFTGSNRFILDYLSEEVIEGQTEEVKSFLLYTSVLERLCGPLCDAVLGDAHHSAQMLADLEHKNLFLIPLDDERQWYRYHHLFSELLFQNLKRTHPDLLVELYRHATGWFEANGYLEDAIGYALKAQEYDYAAQLMNQIRINLLNHGEIHRLQNWLRLLPDEMVRSQPELCFGYATCLTMPGYYDEAEKWLKLAEAGIGQVATSSRHISLSEHKFITYRSLYARFRGDFVTAISLAQRALELVQPTELRDMGVILLFLGQAHFYAGNMGAAERFLTEAIKTNLTSGHVEAYLGACHHLAKLRVLQGRLHDAGAIYEQAVRFIRGHGTPIFSGTELAGLADLNREWNQLGSVAAEIEEGIQLAEAGDHILTLTDTYLSMVRLAISQKDWETARRYLQKADQGANRCPTSIEIPYLQAWQARLFLAQGNLEGAAAWAEAKGQEDTASVDIYHEFEQLTLARFRLAEGITEEAAGILSRVQTIAESAGRYGQVLEARMLHALVLQAAGEETTAIAELSQVLVAAAPEGYVRLFLDEGAPMAKLLYKLSAQAEISVRDYAGRLLSAYSQEQAEPAAPLIKASKGARSLEPLSKREVEVLQLMANGCSNKEIAAQLVISIGTVKRHIVHILQKLDAANRTQAVTIARQLEII